jgi:hypothetical protein
MSDVMPKVKLYIFISIISLIVNIGVILFTMINSNSNDISSIVISGTGIITAFIPFVSIISFALIGLPLPIFTLITLFTTILSTVQTLIIAFIILQTVKNLIWQPDV